MWLGLGSSVYGELWLWLQRMNISGARTRRVPFRRWRESIHLLFRGPRESKISRVVHAQSEPRLPSIEAVGKSSNAATFRSTDVWLQYELNRLRWCSLVAVVFFNSSSVVNSPKAPCDTCEADIVVPRACPSNQPADLFWW